MVTGHDDDGKIKPFALFPSILAAVGDIEAALHSR